MHKERRIKTTGKKKCEGRQSKKKREAKRESEKIDLRRKKERQASKLKKNGRWNRNLKRNRHWHPYLFFFFFFLNRQSYCFNDIVSPHVTPEDILSTLYFQFLFSIAIASVLHLVPKQQGNRKGLRETLKQFNENRSFVSLW